MLVGGLAAKNKKEFWFDMGLTTRQDYFTHLEPSQSLGGAETGATREKPVDHPQAEFGLSHVWSELVEKKNSG